MFFLVEKQQTGFHFWVEVVRLSNLPLQQFEVVAQKLAAGPWEAVSCAEGDWG